MRVKSVKKMTKSDLYQALYPIYHISKAWGILPVRFKKLGSGKYLGKLHFVEVTYSVCLHLAFVCAEFWGLYRDLRDGLKSSTRMESKTNMVVSCVDFLAITTLATISVLGAPFRWSEIQNIIDRLVEVDERLGIVSIKKTRRFSMNVILGSLTFLFLLCASDYCVWNEKMKNLHKMNDKGQINYTPLYLLYVIIILMEDQIALVTYNLNQRFVRLNECLENMLRTFFPNDLTSGDYTEHGQFGAVIKGHINGKPPFRRGKISAIELVKSSTKNSADIIIDFVRVHSLLSDAALSINNAFGLPALVVVITCLLHLIVTPYFFILGIYESNDTFFLAAEMMWCIGHFSRLLIIIQPCYAASVEANKTGVLVSQLLSVNPERQSREQLKIFSLQLLHRQLEFSACGLFSLNRPLITSIAGAITTYLVILLQFHKEDTPSA